MSMHEFISTLNILYTQLKKEKEQADEDKENNSLDASTITNAINNAAAGLKH